MRSKVSTAVVIPVVVCWVMIL